VRGVVDQAAMRANASCGTRTSVVLLETLWKFSSRPRMLSKMLSAEVTKRR
jgi:hypothetical protein